MRFLHLLLFFLTTSLWANSELTTQIHDIDYGRDSSEKDLLFLESGHVVPVTNQKMIPPNFNRKTKWHFILNDKNEIIHMSEVKELPNEKLDLLVREDYEPTKIKSGEAKKYFN